MFRVLPRVFGWLLVGFAGTVAVFSTMFVYVGTQVPVNIRMGGKVSDNSWDAGLVSASGTWVIENEKQAFPLQYTELRCFRAESACRSATAEVSFGGTLTVDMDYYEVARWTNDTIIFTTSAQCVSYTYTISRASARIVGIRTPKKTTDDTCLQSMGKDTLQLSLKDGFRVQMALEEAARGRAQPFVWTALAILWMFVLPRVWRRKAVGVTEGRSAA
ncbi:hypothetical protein [Bosea sp. 685]|uniref:hypothetical protein n=1 Tax=Bosea sp. 685 TaxID=3080057 RepID=UPI002892E584|nr:hypothetical protein [Bosea sp. 685]WNJ90075.1 hypothetical protein RMR04_27410 [Bosea sp. 685]